MTVRKFAVLLITISLTPACGPFSSNTNNAPRNAAAPSSPLPASSTGKEKANSNANRSALIESVALGSNWQVTEKDSALYYFIKEVGGRAGTPSSVML